MIVVEETKPLTDAEFAKLFDYDLKELEKFGQNLQPFQRNLEVIRLTEDYFKRYGKMPDAYTLTRLGTCLLVEEVKDKSPDKVQRNEFPILSSRQLKTRSKRELSVEGDSMDFLYQKSVKKMDSAFKKRTKNMEE